MTWYKQSQKMPTMEEIIWAIDKIIAEQYEFSVEELQQASDKLNSNQQWGQKAAQVATKRPIGYSRSLDTFPLPDNSSLIIREVMQLFETGMSNKNIGIQLDIPTKQIALILKKYFPSKAHQQKYLREKHEKNILDVTQEQTDEMKTDFDIEQITFEDIAEVLNITPGFVGKVLAENNISLSQLKTERRDKIAEHITEIVKDFPHKFKMKDIIREFYKRHNFKLSVRSANSAVKLLNLGDKAQNNPETIFMAFTVYIYNHQQGGVKALAFLPGKIPILVDGFFNEYGQNHGYPPAISKEELRRMLMAKIQMRDRTEENAQDRRNPNRYNPIVTDESQPSYFLNDPEPQLASKKINWYKKANRWKDHIPGGRANSRKPSDYERSQVEKGKRIEYEHTDNPDTAREISMDHLEEHPDYYHEEKGLPAMEDNLGDKGKLEKKKPTRRGRYPGQDPGDENRPSGQVMDDIIKDNEIIEGPHVKILHNMAVNGNWDDFNIYVQKLKDEGHKQTRIDSMMTRAMYKVKL